MKPRSLLRRLGQWCGRAPAPLPPPSQHFFAVKSDQQLFWLLGRGRNFFFLYERSGGRRALSLWPQSGGVIVCDELGTWRRFVARRHFASSFLGHAIAERRLYVDWLL
jgi:hypothetical protein